MHWTIDSHISGVLNDANQWLAYNWVKCDRGGTSSESPLESDTASTVIWKTSTAYKWYAHWMSVYSIFLIGVRIKPIQSAHTYKQLEMTKQSH